MKIVADSNILFTFFWKDSFTKGILVDQNFEFFAPEIAIHEIKNNKQEITKKTKSSEEEFNSLLGELAIFVEFIPLDEYIDKVSEADVISDKDDIDFIALALKLNCEIWSNDPHLKEQNKVKVYTTSEFIQHIEQS